MQSSLRRAASRLPSWTLALLLAGALTACGGGSDDAAPATPTTPTTPTAPEAPVVILDSFGQVVDLGGSGSSGVGAGDSGADGSAGDGAGIANGRVDITDVNGRTVSATTDAQGYYRAKVTGFTPPFVAKVTAPSGKVYHSVNVQPLRVNGFVTLNITSLTDKIASDVARAAGRSGAAALTPQAVTTTAVNQAIVTLRAQLAQVITTAGLDPATFDPLAMPFRPNLKGYDFVMESTIATVDSSGQTQLAITPEFVPTLAGNWRLSLEEGGQTETIATTFPASAVPNAVALMDADNLAAMIPVIFANDAAQVNGTFTRTGNTVRLTGTNTNYTVIIDRVAVSNFQACGTCGVNSQIRFTLTTTLTEEGTYQGVAHPRSTITETYNLVYTRVN